jgi:NADH:ubiquinone oxidoreductase subunit 5 (subunit L)/multisubunit Na+/H+ antiporter MnhA subunit
MQPNTLLTVLGLAIVATPVLLLTFFLATFLLQRALSEFVISRMVQGAVNISLIAALSAAVAMLWQGIPQYPIELSDWVITPTFHLKFEFVLDVLSLSYVLLTLLLCTVIAGFSTRYLHRDPGYARFFVLYSIFLLGMVTAALSDTVETLFAGWELVGLASVLLIAFFHARPAPPRNGLRVWVIYRVCDVALLLAAILMHELNGAGDFDRLVGESAWPEHDPLLIGPHFTLLGVLFLIAAAGKSALLPFSGWLPRAMEGPTPSSAIFYGALSVHLGVFLLLRVSPVLDSAPWLSALVVVLGLLSALFAYLTGRVQTDIKSALAFASLAQVGIIIAEIGLGLRYLALLHLLGHACLRTLQFLRAPSMLHDHHQLENAIGTRPRAEKEPWEDRLSASWQHRLYRFALERGYLDVMLDKLVARPFLGFFRFMTRLEDRWAHTLEGESPETSKPALHKEPAGRGKL